MRPAAALLCVSALAILLAPIARSAEITIDVRSASRTSVRGAYLAVVPEWRSSAEPLRERVVEKNTATFSLPPGRYHIIAGAPGYTTASVGPISITGNETESIAISPLIAVHGTVRDVDGHPLAGVSVSMINAAVDLQYRTLSPLATQHLSSNLKTISNEEGRWTLPVPAATVPLIFDLAGYGAEWRLFQAGPAEADVTLRRGAALSVRLDRTDSEALLTLTRDEAKTSSIPVARQEQLWARRAASELITWPSLPPGKYTVRATFRAPQYLASSPTIVAQVALAEGTHVEAPATLPKRPAATSTASIFADDSYPSDLNDAQVFTSSKGTERPIPHRVTGAVGGSVIYIPQADALEQAIVVGGEYLIAAPAQHGTFTEPVSATVFFRADVSAHVRSLEKDLPLPANGIAHTSGCSGVDDVAIPISVRPSGLLMFPAPAGCRSISLDLLPFEPVNVARTLQRGDQSMGEIPLRAAGAADVKVTLDEGIPATEGEVQILAIEGADQPPIVVAKQPIDKDGWARFATIPVDRELRIAAKSGSRQSDLLPLRVRPRQRLVIDPLHVGAPAALTIVARIDASVLRRVPTAQVLALFLTPQDPFRIKERRQENLARTGSEVTFESLGAGRWKISALVSVGKGTYAPIEVDTVELKEGEQRRLTPLIAPPVFEGIVTSHGAPVGAKVVVDLDSKVVKFQADADGTFQALLDRAGTYRVAVERLDNQGSDIPVGMVEFSNPSRRVEIALPDTAAVTVKTSIDGHPPAAGTIVFMTRQDTIGADQLSKRARPTDAAGEVTFSEVAAGAWTFSADDAQSDSSGEITVGVSTEDKVVDLPLRRSSTIEGNIYGNSSDSGARSFIECVGMSTARTITQMTGTADVEGRFSITIPAPPPAAATCAAISPMGAVELFRAKPGQKHQVRLVSSTGTLIVDHWLDTPAHGWYWLIDAEGGAVNLRTIGQVIPQSSSALVIPSLPVGRWRIVATSDPSSLEAVVGGLGTSVRSDTEVSVAAGRVEHVSLLRVPAH